VHLAVNSLLHVANYSLLQTERVVRAAIVLIKEVSIIGQVQVSLLLLLMPFILCCDSV
jgi:hypothetical protein